MLITNLIYGTLLYIDAPKIINDRTFLSLRAISESLGKQTFYNNGFIVISDQIVDYDNNEVEQFIKSLRDLQLILMIGSNQTFINGNKKAIDINNDIKPIIKNSRVLVPVRYIAQNFGAHVTWDNDTRRINITQGDKNIRFTIGSNEMNLNGIRTQLDVAPEIINGRTLLPLRAISESLDKNVFYDSGLIAISNYSIGYSKGHVDYLKEALNNYSISTDIVSKTLDKVVLVEGIANKVVESFGSVFFVADGLIMTSYHVVDDYDEIQVTDIYENKYTVDCIYIYDISRDIILLKLDKRQSLNNLSFANFDDIQVGEMVLALGNPEGLNWSVTQGIVSTFRENLFMDSHFIQIDAAVSYGSSGGPLLNQNGDVIGIISEGVENENLNFAVIPYGINEIIEYYNKTDFEKVTLVPESDFILTEKD